MIINLGIINKTNKSAEIVFTLFELFFNKWTWTNQKQKKKKQT